MHIRSRPVASRIFTFERIPQELTELLNDAFKNKIVILIRRNLPITELGLILKDHLNIRTSADHITLYESVGFAPLDLAMAIEVYHRVNSDIKKRTALMKMPTFL